MTRSSNAGNGRPLRRLAARLTVLGMLCLGLLVLYFFLSRVYPFDWSVIPRYKLLFFDGLKMTLSLSAFSLGLSVLIGLVISLARTSKVQIAREFGATYVWFFRNMPLLVVILLVYYGVGSIVMIDRFWAGVVSLAVFEGAYVAEIFRSGIEAVPEGEIEAARAFGLYNSQVFGSVIFPRAFRIAIPPLVGQLVSLVKDSSLVSVIALGDLTMRARQVGTQTLATLEAYIVLAGVYLSITSLLSFLGNCLERRLKIP